MLDIVLNTPLELSKVEMLRIVILVDVILHYLKSEFIKNDSPL